MSKVVGGFIVDRGRISGFVVNRGRISECCSFGLEENCSFDL